MKTKSFLVILIVLFLPRLCSADADFFGRWTPPKSLSEFWKPLNRAWWNADDNSRLYNYCKRFARKSNPTLLIDDIIEDLKKNPSIERTFVYSMLIVNWDRRITLKLLKPYYESDDPDVRKIASDFIADIEETKDSHDD